MSPVARLRVAGFALAGLVYWADQWIKGHVRYTLNLPEVGTIEILPFFNLHWTQNYGASMGMLTFDSLEMRYGLIVLTALIALGVLVWMLRERDWPEIVGLGMVLGGAAGNIRDRLNYGYVVDYADFFIGEWHFYVFNLADAAITIGIAIVLARSFFSREKRDDGHVEDATRAAPADATES